MIFLSQAHFAIISFLTFDCLTECRTSGRHKRVGIYRRDGNPTHGSTENEACLREKQHGHENRAQRAFVRRENTGAVRPITNYRRGVASSMGRSTARPRGHSPSC